MWVAFTFIGYLVLAMAAPTAWALWHTWRRAQTSRLVTCPALEKNAFVTLDPWYAVRMHALGERESRIKECACWPERRECGRECLLQIGSVV